MNINRFYSLDETTDKDKVLDKLDKLEENGKISFILEDNNIIDIEDLDLDIPETKNLISFFEKYDVLEYTDREDDSNDSYFDPSFYDFN